MRLMEAIKAGNIDRVRQNLQDKDIQDKIFNDTNMCKEALDTAFETANANIICLLLCNGNPKFLLEETVKKRCRQIISKAPTESLHLALKAGDSGVPSLLIHFGIKVTNESLDLTIKSGDAWDVAAVLKAGGKPTKNSLNLAIKSRNERIVAQIVAAGAKARKNSLDLALQYGSDYTVYATLEDAGAKPTKDSLDLAIKSGSDERVESILAAGAEPTTDSLPLALKVGWHSDMIIRRLLKADAEITAETFSAIMEKTDMVVDELLWCYDKKTSFDGLIEEVGYQAVAEMLKHRRVEEHVKSSYYNNKDFAENVHRIKVIAKSMAKTQPTLAKARARKAKPGFGLFKSLFNEPNYPTIKVSVQEKDSDKDNDNDSDKDMKLK